VHQKLAGIILVNEELIKRHRRQEIWKSGRSGNCEHRKPMSIGADAEKLAATLQSSKLTEYTSRKLKVGKRYRRQEIWKSGRSGNCEYRKPMSIGADAEKLAATLQSSKLTEYTSRKLKVGKRYRRQEIWKSGRSGNCEYRKPMSIGADAEKLAATLQSSKLTEYTSRKLKVGKRYRRQEIWKSGRSGNCEHRKPMSIGADAEKLAATLQSSKLTEYII
jgi:hypothetical protein